MRAGITLAALVAAASAEVVIVTKVDVSTVTVVVPPGGGPAPTQHAAPAPASKQETEPVKAPQSAPQVQAAPHSAPQPQSNNPLANIISSVVDSVYQSAVVGAHNAARARHGAQGLQWSDDLARIAQQQANGCQWGHFTNLDGQSYGQNIAAGVDPSQISNVITGLFYNNEEPAFAPYYGNPNPPNFEAWGHFTQVVWKETTHVGCYTYSCGGGLAGMSLPGMNPFYTVCNYSPAGNMAGQYANQVGAPTS